MGVGRLYAMWIFVVGCSGLEAGGGLVAVYLCCEGCWFGNMMWYGRYSWFWLLSRYVLGFFVCVLIGWI